MRGQQKETNEQDAHLLSNVQAETVTISVVQLLRKVMWGLLSTHVVYSPAPYDSKIS